MLDGGLVSLSTLAPDTLACMQSMSSGAVICLYKYHPRDVLVKTDSRDPSVECSESSSLEIDPSENAKMEATDANEAEVELKVDVDVGETNERGKIILIITINKFIKYKEDLLFLNNISILLNLMIFI